MSYCKFSASLQSLLAGSRNGGRSLEESISNIINNPVIQNRVLNSDLNPCQVDITILRRLKPLGLCNCSLEADIPDVPLACNMTPVPLVQGELPTNCICDNNVQFQPASFIGTTYLFFRLAQPRFVPSIPIRLVPNTKSM